MSNVNIHSKQHNKILKMNPVLLQKQIRDNNNDLQDFCKDLKGWGEEMKRKDDSLAGRSNEEPPKASKAKKSSKKQKEISDKQEVKEKKHVTFTNYDKWEKFDVDAECEKIDNGDESDELTDEFDDSMKEEALVQKQKGNKFVVNQQWDEAIECYTKAIDCYAYDPIFFANRALCYLKKQQMEKAEKDCSTSLKLDGSYVKAYQRRAAARESLNKLQDAERDYLKVLDFEPNNKESKAGLQKLRLKLPKTEPKVEIATDKRPVSRFTTARNLKKSTERPTQASEPVKKSVIEHKLDTQKPKELWPSHSEPIIPVAAVNKPPHLRSKKPLKRIEITELSNEIKKEDPIISWPLPNSSQTTIKSDEFKVIERKMPEACKIKEAKNVANLESVKFKTMDEKFDQLVKENGKSEEITTESFFVPKTSVQFYSTWKHLKSNQLKYKFLRSIKPEDIPVIFKESLETDYFSEFLRLFAEFVIQNTEPVFEYLSCLTCVKRFSAFVMFLSINDKNCLWKLFNYIKSTEGKPKEEVDELIKKYEL